MSKTWVRSSWALSRTCSMIGCVSFYLSNLGELETAEIHVPQVFSVSKHSPVLCTKIL